MDKLTTINYELHDNDCESYDWQRAMRAASHSLECEDESEVGAEMALIGVTFSDGRRTIPVDVVAKVHVWS